MIIMGKLDAVKLVVLCCFVLRVCSQVLEAYHLDTPQDTPYLLNLSQCCVVLCCVCVVKY